ncbi:hypothetical protein RJ640_009044 [Escallonia rubra]|uniref:CRM domain-containing protein n=1 Tax=Escallonia rubra TaxID=112253 RepID=A0AA88R708_9ASTE|nr:hypothetical protein RJ640_009044 [Escallonia rubra]
MFSTSSIRSIRRGLYNINCNKFNFHLGKRDSLICYDCLVQNISYLSFLPKATLFTRILAPTHHRSYKSEGPLPGACHSFPGRSSLLQGLSIIRPHNVLLSWLHFRYLSNSSIELKTENDVVKFSFGKPTEEKGTLNKGKKTPRRFKMSKKAKVNELRLYRLKAKKKMKSPNPEVRIRYRLDKAKRKEEWLIEKLRKFEIPKAPVEAYDPENLTEEERFYLKRTGEKKKNYVPVGRRGVFGGVVLNMHLHWKKHETVKVVCKPCKPGQIHVYAEELARLSKGMVIDIKPNNTILFYRGKNYVQPTIMSPLDTLSKAKALEKYTYEQSLEHTSQFIEKLEKELEEYHNHLARYREQKESALLDSAVGT